MYRKTWMEINLNAIKENVHYIKSICKKNVMAVLKADGYGCGDIHVCQAALEGGADSVAVSSLEEAIVLRNEGYTGSILILGTVSPSDVSVLIHYGIACAAFSTSWVKEIMQYDVKDLLVHLVVDTGMNRIGFKNNQELVEAFHILEEAGCTIEGIFTHFYSAEETDHTLTNKQFALFKQAVRSLPHPVPLVHCDNSDATFFHHDDISNMCRVGISMYGISTYDTSLQYPISLFTTSMLCKKVAKGETIGYGHTYTTEEEEYIITCPIGYADGLVRTNQGRKVYVDNSYGTIVGRICMDQVMIKVDHEIKDGTKVEIFGPHISLESMAEELNTIPYEIICLISGRVTRVYTDGEKVISEQNDRVLRSEVQNGYNL